MDVYSKAGLTAEGQVLRTPRLALFPSDEADAGVGPKSIIPAHGAMTAKGSAFDIRRHSDERIGSVAVRSLFDVWIDPCFRGRGFGFEAATAVLDRHFAAGSAAPLSASAVSSDDARLRLLRSLGFRRAMTNDSGAQGNANCGESCLLTLNADRWAHRSRLELRTPRLFIRPLVKRDAEPLIGLATPDVATLVDGISAGMSRATARAFIMSRQWAGLPGFLLGVEDVSGKLVGCLGFGGEPLSVMCFFGEDYRGLGYATEAGRAFVEALFERFPLSALRAEHLGGNEASRRVLLKLGFQQFGPNAPSDGAERHRIRYRLARSFPEEKA